MQAVHLQNIYIFVLPNRSIKTLFTLSAKFLVDLVVIYVIYCVLLGIVVSDNLRSSCKFHPSDPSYYISFKLLNVLISYAHLNGV